MQASHMTDRALREVHAGQPTHQGRHRLGRTRGRRWGLTKELAAALQLGCAAAVGKQPNVADPHKAIRHHVEKEATQEFLCR